MRLIRRNEGEPGIQKAQTWFKQKKLTSTEPHVATLVVISPKNFRSCVIQGSAGVGHRKLAVDFVSQSEVDHLDPCVLGVILPSKRREVQFDRPLHREYAALTCFLGTLANLDHAYCENAV